jgi:peptidoglycan/LPS O-acetylase OafA/YrhL
VRDRSGSLLTFALFPTEYGPLGVVLFFAISGFCIHLAARRTVNPATGETDWLAFWKRRVYRLYPPYLGAIALSLAVYYLTDGATYFFELNRVVDLPADLALHLTMTHNLTARYSLSLANGAFWSLGLEEQLYALYAVYAMWRKRLSPLQIAGVALAIALAWRFFVVVPCISVTWGPLGTWWTWPFSWWFSWIVGAVVAEAYDGTTTLPRWCSSGILAAALAVVAAPIYANVVLHPAFAPFVHASDAREQMLRKLSQVSDVVFSIVFAIVMLRLVTRERRAAITSSFWRWAARLGGISYSLYLVHSPIIGYVSAKWLRGDSGPEVALRYVVVVPLAVAVAALFYAVIERHFLHRARASRAPAAVPATE